MDITTDRDVFFIRMSTLEDKQMVLEESPIFIAGKIFDIRLWSPEAENHRNKATTVLIWAMLSKVPKELCTKNRLSFLASLIGRPLCMDGATFMKQRLDFAKICVTIPLEFDFPSSIKLKIRDRHVYVDVEYPWKPPSCTKCCCFGHYTAKCPSSPAPVWVPRSSNVAVQNPAAVVRVPRAYNVLTSSTPAVTSSIALATPHMGTLLATPAASLQERISPLLDRSILGSSPFSLRASGSSSAFIRDRSNALRPNSSFIGRGNEVVIFSTPQVQQASITQDAIILTEEELYNFQVESNTYAALTLDEDGIEDDISDNQEDPFDDQCVNTPLISRLSMPSQVTTRAQLQQ
ncbi:hypothetical protein IFM89_002505 [Coptis chinensis]|uniref:DUF4283 domain-containing protein n=1 Tax=Coptis chinensis TaxID=261450 RepID=A0A835HKK5_9MAGN|nr:hypothetical protein IFM89_002505 [Coptis chinensis]